MSKGFFCFLGSANTALYDRSQPSNALAACDTLQQNKVHMYFCNTTRYTCISDPTLVPDDENLENSVLYEKYVPQNTQSINGNDYY
jgi:hypothetical protein